MMTELTDAFVAHSRRHRHARRIVRGVELERARLSRQAVRPAQRRRLLGRDDRLPRPCHGERLHVAGAARAIAGRRRRSARRSTSSTRRSARPSRKWSGNSARAAMVRRRRHPGRAHEISDRHRRHRADPRHRRPASPRTGARSACASSAPPSRCRRASRCWCSARTWGQHVIGAMSTRRRQPARLCQGGHRLPVRRRSPTPELGPEFRDRGAAGDHLLRRR